MNIHKYKVLNQYAGVVKKAINGKKMIDEGKNPKFINSNSTIKKC